MTLGEKIKYYRNEIGITQARLAELSGIHPVSIRKYETNKMVPQTQQIIKLADALNVSPFAFIDISDSIRLETTGDSMGFLIMLLKSNILYIDGKRNSDGIIEESTATFKTHKFFADNFKFELGNKKILLKDINATLKSEAIFKNILAWEGAMKSYKKMITEYENLKDNEQFQQLFASYKELVELAEVKLYQSNLIYDDNGGVSVKYPSKYFD